MVIKSMYIQNFIPRFLISSIGCFVGLLLGLLITTSNLSAEENRYGIETLPTPQPKVVTAPAQEPAQELVTDLRIEGNITVDSAKILSQLQTRIGRPFDLNVVKRDVRKLIRMGWFVDVQPHFIQGKEGRIVVFQVIERPTVRYLEFIGNASIRDKNLKEETGIQLGHSVDPYAVEEARRKLVELYKAEGFNNISITVQEGNRPTDRGVVFILHEGVQQTVSKVIFAGNTFVSAGRLKQQIQLKPGKLNLIFPTNVDLEQIQRDVTSLTAYYRSFGYFEARIGRRLEWNPKGNLLTIRYIISEGPRFQIRNVVFQGNEKFESGSLSTGLKLKSGQDYEQYKLQADLAWLKELYGSQGYVFASIEAEQVYLEETGKIDLVYHISEGTVRRVRRIFVHIKGENPHTKIGTVLSRISIKPNDIIDTRETNRSKTNLTRSGLFENKPGTGLSPTIEYVIPDLELSKQMRSEQARRPQRHTTHYRGANQPAYQQPAQQRPVSNNAWRQPQPAYQQPAQPRQPRLRSTYPVQPATYSQQPAYQQPAQPRFNQPPATRAQQLRPAAQPFIVRGQNNTNYGGQAVRATGPSTVPAGQSQGTVSPNNAPVQQVLYGEYAPTRPGQAEALHPDPSITPIVPMGELPRGLLNPNYYGPPGTPFPEDAIDLHINVNETQTGKFMLGMGVNSSAGLTGQISLDERNFDWRLFPRSWSDLTNGRAFRGGGQHFRLEAAPGTQVQRYMVSWSDPHWAGTPVSVSTSASYFGRRFTDWTEQRVGGRIGTGYNWIGHDLAASVSYRGERIKILDATLGSAQLAAVTGKNNYLHGFGLNIANDTRDSSFLATKGHLVKLGLEQVVGSYTYTRFSADLRQYFLMHERPDHSGRHVLSIGTRVNFSGTDTPIYENYFAGGFSTLRGFDYRGASPTESGVRVGGRFMWLNTVEYLFPVAADDMLHGVLFCDFGTVESNISVNKMRVAPGFGLRISVPALGPAPIALDFAWAINHADTDEREVFSFTVGLQR